MAEKWRRYETLMIFDPGLGPEGTEDLVQKAREYVSQATGRVLKTERWGVRDLAYELKGRRKGFYLLLEYAGVPRVATELDRRLNLLDTVVKFQTVKLEEAVDPESLPEPVEIHAETTAKPAPEATSEADEAKGEGDEESDEGADEGEDQDEETNEDEG